MSINIERLSHITAVLMLLLVEVFVPTNALGQDAVVPLQFSYSDPGARSMGFGGAFVALADDATAAFANPAGLVQLLKPEVSIEGRRWSYSTPFTEGGRVEGLPSGVGIDSTVGLRRERSDDGLTGLSYVSLVYPKENWSFAFFRHQLANFEFFSETQGLFGGGSNCCQIRTLDQRARNNLEIESYGLSTAYRISDTFALGFGVVYDDAAFVSEATLFFVDEDSTESIFSPNSYLPERSVFTETISVNDSDWAFTGGFLWRLSESWSIGGVYRQAPKIDIEFMLTAGETVDFGVPPGAVFDRKFRVLEMPEIYGLGFAYRAPNGRLTVTFQWDRVEYSSIGKSLEIDDEAIDDVHELHLGAEYVFLDATPIIAVRFGTWFEPDHQFRSTSDNPFARAVLPRGENEMHYAAGLGVAIQSFQIDLGVDFADRVDTFSLSAIYNF